jgi:hypothetical protein
VDEARARDALAEFTGRVAYICGDLGTNGRVPWDLDPAKLPRRCHREVAALASYYLSKATGIEGLAALGYHPRYIKATGRRPPGPEELRVFHQLMMSSSEPLSLLAKITHMYITLTHLQPQL